MEPVEYSVKLAEIAYFVDDIPAMTNFYRQLLGSEPAAQSEGMAIFMVGETRIFLHKKYQPSVGDLPPENHIALTMNELDKFCHSLARTGLTLEIPPADYYWGRSAYLRDPEGHLIELSESQDEASHGG
jgi:catechol 2,3-dioxygenase-like lactoylglutathione lyase family enzyme